METWPHEPFAHLAAAGRSSFSLGPFGSKVTTEDYATDGVPFIRGINLNRGIFRDSDFAFITEGAANEVKSAHVSSGDLIFTRKGTIGQVSMIPRTSAYPEYVISSSQMKAKLDESRSVPEFYYYWFRSPQGQRALLANASQVGVPSIANSLATLRGLKVPTPPMKDQAAIAEVLGALDDKITANERQLVTLNEFCSAWHQLIIDRADANTSSHTLAELVKHGFMTLGDGYRTKQSEHGEPGLPILRVADVGHGAITPSFTHHVSNAYRAAMGPKVSRQSDVILTTKGTVGRVALIEAGYPEFVYSPQVCYFRLANNSPVSPLYLMHWFQGKEFWSQAGGLKSQTDMADYLSLRDIRSLRITVPTPAGLTEFSRICNPMQEQAEARRRENDTLTALRDTLLPQLVTGKIRVKDAEQIMEDVA
ncbi:restriction endonuclease subunit S [Streptomyces sp. NPDC059002]|uniref:restriction endonuclease subunit S n=1 Tax=Streptomyces sp. NPDC059002 TaxID=3346690 RepID=UPI003681ACD5